MKSQTHDIEGVRWDSLNETWTIIHPVCGNVLEKVGVKPTRHEAIKCRWHMELVNDSKMAISSEAFEYMRQADEDYVLSIFGLRRRG